jgi:hypothetical protein
MEAKRKQNIAKLSADLREFPAVLAIRQKFCSARSTSKQNFANRNRLKIQHLRKSTGAMRKAKLKNPRAPATICSA